MRRGGLMALAALLAGFSPFRAEERNVRDGNERLASGDPATALSRYDEAEKAAGAHAEIEYDRGGALYRLGRRAEARQAWRRSQERAPGALSSRASQNIGTALASEGDREGAIAAFTEALRQDPRNEDARFNLEVLLRRKEEEQQQQQQQQQGPGHEEGEAQSQAGRESPPPGQQPRQRPPRERAPEDGGAREGADQSQGGRSGAEGAGGEMSRQDAERILDAFRAQDRIAPPPGGERRRGWRADGDRDW